MLNNNNNNNNTIDVHKTVDLDYDEGNLLVCDTTPFESFTNSTHMEETIKSLNRDNTQLLINKIWQLPMKRIESTLVCMLPDLKIEIPREKPIPKAKPETKWEKYAKAKSILNKKKTRMVWDETVKDWRPRWGYKRAGDEKLDWVLEVPQTSDPFEDQFEKKASAKKERIAKNEMQRLRNLARSKNRKVPGVGLTPTDKPDKEYLKKALAVTRRSTASMGKFDKALPQEKVKKERKQKIESNFNDVKIENKKILNIISTINKKQPILNAEKLAKTAILNNQLEVSKKQKLKRTVQKKKIKGRKNK